MLVVARWVNIRKQTYCPDSSENPSETSLFTTRVASSAPLAIVGETKQIQSKSNKGKSSTWISKDRM